MPDIPASQTVITNALNQLSQLAPSSDIAQKGVEVLTKHLAGNILSLSKTSGLLAKTVLLKQPEIKGNIQTNQPHQVKLSLNSTTTALPTLDFFSATSKTTSTDVLLTAKQVQTLLSLPAKQLLVSSGLVTNKDTAQLPRLSATVLASLPAEVKLPAQPIAAAGKLLVNQPKPEPQIAGQKAAPQLRLSLTEQRPPVEVNLAIKSAQTFAVGEKVSLAISPKGVNWQVSITPDTSQTNTPKPGSPTVTLTSATKVTLQPNMLSPLPKQSSSGEAQQVSPSLSAKVAGQQILLSPQQAAPLIQASLREQPNSKAVTLEIPLKAVIQQLNKVQTLESQALVQKLQSTAIDKLAMQILPNGEAKLLLQTNKPVASIVINKELANQLAPLRLPNQHNLQNIVNAKTEAANSPANNIPANPATQAQAQIIKDQPKPTNPQHIQSQTSPTVTTEKTSVSITRQTNELIKPSLANSVNLTSTKPTQSIENPNKSPETALNLKEASAQLLNIIGKTPIGQSVVTPELMNNKQQQTNLLQSLLRIVKAKAEAPAVTLQSIEKALADPDFFKASTEQSGKQLVEQVLTQIKQALPQGKEQDSNQIRQLLTAPTLNLSALQMVSPAPSQGIMGGLITLLQISLSARLSRNQTGRSEQISKVLNDFLGSGTDNTKAPITPKALNDLSQLEQKHQLMKEIGRLLSGHQTSKLNNAEQMLQGQDSFYYNLPSALAGNLKDIELLIKREEQHKDQQENEQSNNQTWQLTMKLAVGEIGELLTKAKLREHNLELNFYASNDNLKNQVLNYLPLLRRKLDSLGIEMSKSHCQLGKIPDTLQQRPYHVFQAKA